MPLVSETTIGGGLVSRDALAVKRFSLLERRVVAKKRVVYSRGELKALPGRSLLSQVGEAWGLLSQAEKDAWSAAGAIVSMSGFNLFTQDKVYRIKHDIEGNATPSLYHQYLIGHLNIAEGSGDVLLRQVGFSVVSFPATLYLRRKLALSADPSNGEFIKVRFKYDYDEGGGVLTQSDELSLSLTDSWGSESLGITEHTGATGDWEFEIETHALKGDFYFDDFYVLGASGVITKDMYCEKVVKKWGLVEYPAGALIETLYPTGDAL